MLTMLNSKTFFDSASTTPLDPRVRDAMDSAQGYWGNENSKHHHGFQSAKQIKKHIETIAHVLHCSPDQLAVTYSGTDSNRRIIHAAAKRIGFQNCWCSAVEHASILDEIPQSQRFDPISLNSTSQQPFDPSTPSLLALMAANSETGRIYNGEDLKVKYPNALILRDYSQSFSKGILPDLENTDFGTFSPQKIYGPKMIGLTYLRDPQNFQEISKDSHTKSVSLIAGMAKAFEIWSEEKDDNTQNLTKWDTQIRQYITSNIPNHKFHEAEAVKVSGLINIAFDGVRGGELMTMLSQEEQIAISIGSACTSDIMSPTDVIKHIEPEERWRYPIRIGLHKYLDDESITDFCEILEHYVSELRK